MHGNASADVVAGQASTARCQQHKQLAETTEATKAKAARQVERVRRVYLAVLKSSIAKQGQVSKLKSFAGSSGPARTLGEIPEAAEGQE
eukprot:5946271-Alexandrium_andersonii.AAC.1